MIENSATLPPGDDIDPDIRRFVREVNADYARLSKGGETIPERRAIAEQVRAPWREGGPQMARTDEFRIGGRGVRIRVHRPTEGGTLPVLVYLHGGGWTSFSLDTHDRLMREYAARGGGAVVGVDYSLSPEVRFPVALSEIAETLEWLRREGADHGLDTANIVIGGDSAGANLALAAMMRAREAKAGSAKGMLLNYGAFDERPRASHARYGGPEYMLTPEEMDWFWRNYRGDDRLPDPLATPLNGSFDALPPAFMCIAECDILRDENLVVAEKLEEAGAAVDVHVYQGATHSFLEAMSISPLANRAIDDAAAWLRTIWGAR